MDKGIAHEWSEETPEAKARWFRSLFVAERVEVFCAHTDLILAVQPHIADRKDAQQTRPGVRILSLDDLAARRAAGLSMGHAGEPLAP